MPEDSTAPPAYLHHPREAYDWTRISAELNQAGLRPAEFRVYCHLLTAADKTHVAWPGVSTIAEVCRLKRNTVCSALQSLHEAGFIKKTRTISGTTYHILKKEFWKPCSKRILPKQSIRIEQCSKGILSQESIPIEQCSKGILPVLKKDTLPEKYPDPDCPDKTPSSLFSPFSSPHTPLLIPLPISSSPKEIVKESTIEAIVPHTNTKKSRPSSFEELKAYVVDELDLSENDACALWEHWKGNGFTNNRVPMKDWRAVASNWERRGFFYPSIQPPPKFGFSK